VFGVVLVLNDAELDFPRCMITAPKMRGTITQASLLLILISPLVLQEFELDVFGGIQVQRWCNLKDCNHKELANFQGKQ